MTREIVTFQFGNYSNYIGAHYWNIQENQFVYSNDQDKKQIPDINHDIMFREGLNIQNRLTYTPRMILFDLKENINVIQTTVKQTHKQHESNLNWQGKLQVFESEKLEKSKYLEDIDKNEEELIEFEKCRAAKKKASITNHLKSSYNMEDEVKYWTDYMKLKYHDRSFMLINQYQSVYKDSEPFDLYNYGLNTFDGENFHYQFEDNLRHFAEECDHIQGFQFFVDAYNGFGGLTQKSLNILNEEYSKKPVFAFLPFPSYNEQATEMNTQKLVNTSLTIKSLLSEKSDIIVVPLSLFDSFYSSSKDLNPIYLKNVKYKPNLDYHTSAILASLIDSVTSVWRQKSQHTSMNEVVDGLDVYKYNIASLQAKFPFELENNSYLFNYLQEADLHKTATSFTPLCSQKHKDSESDSLEGAFNVFCKGIEDEQAKNEKDDFYFKGIVSSHSVLNRYFMDMYPKCKSRCFSTRTPLDINLPFPNIINVETDLALKDNKFQNMKAKEISLITILQVNKNVSEFTKYLESTLLKLNINKQTKYLENGMESDDFLELNNFIREICDCFSV